MSTLSSSSTDAQIWAAYDDNASWEEDASLAKAKAFVTACLILQRRRPERATVDGQFVAFDADAVQAALDRARTFVASNAANNAGRALYRDFRDCRS